MMKVKRNITIPEVILFVGALYVLVYVGESFLKTTPEKEKEQEIKQQLTEVKNALCRYYVLYSKAPDDLDLLLSENNTCEQELLHGDEIPTDPYSPEEYYIQMIPEVSEVAKDVTGNITAIKNGGQNFVVYSVGPNCIDDGGINDGNGKDDISLYVNLKLIVF